MGKVLLLILFLGNSAAAQVNLTQGLIAHYPFSGNANDISGNNINGTVTNATLTTDRYGNASSAYYFNASNSYIELPFSNLYNFAPQDSFSISVWVLPDQGYSWPAQAVVVKAPFHSDFTLSQWNYGSYILNYKAMSGYAYNHVLNGTTTFTSTQCWYNIITTYKNGIWKLYVNGVLEASDPSQTKFILQDGFSKIVFGKKGESFGDFYKGKMDDVRLYNRVLTQDEAMLLSQSPCTQLTCNNWLRTQAVGQSVTVGDLDISGNQMTVEANFNCTSFPLSGLNYWEDIVSKHSNTTDANYVLRMDLAAITTTTGHYLLSPACNNLALNKTFHVALVYDGTSLKFYRNGFLMGQMPVTGNLILNNWMTTIGDYAVNNPVGTNFFGYINEVKIWNVARTQGQLQAYMNTSLLNPTTQTGLLGYYTFDNLLNKQGNAAYNGTLNGGATINNTNPNCAFVADSCPVYSVISNIINNYTPVLALNPCDNKITVENASAFNTGDTVMMIQMKGAVIDSTNTAAFGTITDYKNSGNYEFNFVKSKSGNIIELKNVLTRQYDIPVGKVQLIRVPYYTNANVSSTLTCPPWDGSKGGVLVLNVQDTVNLSANIDASGKGFRGGTSPNTGSTTTYCSNNNYFYATGNLAAAAKGESIAIIGNGIAWGKGSPSNGGGGGNGHNSGGGGGSNGSSGGFGGYQLLPCGAAPFDNRGIGGHALTYTNALNRIYMGGGGGSGHTDNAGGSAMEGGNGGGIIIIRSKVIVPNGLKIVANGDNARQCNFATFSDCHDGSGGGGAGGTILIENNNYYPTTSIEAKGGKGGDLIIYNPGAGADKIGPGGGGSGGVVWFNSAANPVNTTSALNFGAGGVIIPNANDPWGATAGQPGISLYDLSIPVATVLFKPNIDSVRIKDSATGCKSFDFKGFGYTNTNPISTWQWYFGDGGTANTQNTSHTYLAAGAFTVKLVVTDINGCKDSITRTVNPIALNFDFNYQVNACNPLTVQFNGAGSDTQNPYWSFGDGGTATGTITTSHTYASQGTYLVKYSVSNGICTDTLFKTIDLSVTLADIISTADTTICLGATKQLLTAPALSFCWTPTTYLNNPNSPTPITSTPQNITYYYTAVVAGTNIINNGNFNAGNTGFTSQYVFANPNVTEGQYFVGPSPQAWNASLSPCTDHTTGNGNMLLVNGSPTPDLKVWTQTVTVTPNTNYAFSTWIQALWPPNPAQLQFSINGNTVGSMITATLPTCTWSQFYTTWNSGNNTSAIISIVNKNVLVTGNDFALDDISFAPVTIRRDSVKITVDTPSVVTNADTPICEGTSIQLNTTGAITYSWTPATGLNNTGIPNPVATPTVTTQYIVTGTNSNGCVAKDSVWITVNPAPVVTTSNDTTICQAGSAQLFASGGASYSWSPAATLNNPSISNPVATPSANTLYYVTVTGANSCSKLDSVNVNVRAASTFAINAPNSICPNASVQLSASGGDLYSWTPAGSLNNPSISNPVASPASTTTYSVQITDTLCNNVSNLSTTITVRPSPVINAAKSNDIDCSVLQSQLSASGAATYSWTPAGTLNNPFSATPIATPLVTTQYTVTGTDAFGCVNNDTITVKVSAINAGGYLMPSAFTPNNDGKNDCYAIKYWGTITQLEFSIFNRWGERVFYTTQPGQCWDGTYKGVPQDANVFIYMITAKTTCQPEVFRKGTFALIR